MPSNSLLVKLKFKLNVFCSIDASPQSNFATDLEVPSRSPTHERAGMCFSASAFASPRY